MARLRSNNADAAESAWTSAPPSATEPRFDTEAVQQVLALATRLQNEHRETLSAREVEEIGAEMGLDPAFVRTAMGTVSGDKLATVGTERIEEAELVTAEAAGIVVEPRITLRQAVWASWPAAAYAIFVWFILASTYEHRRSDVASFLQFGQPVLFAVVLGWRARSPRLGALAGVASALLPALVVILHGVYRVQSGEDYVALEAYAALLAALGYCAAKVRRRVASRRRAQRAVRDTQARTAGSPSSNLSLADR
jgi:hypothetical protein